MIDYSQYTSEDPFRKVDIDKLFESRGIPNSIKEYSLKIFNDIKNDVNFNSNFYNIQFTNDKKINKNIPLNVLFIKDNSFHNLYATSEYLPYVIKIYHKDSYDDIELKKVITHELLHIFEIFNRVDKNSKKDLQWGINNIIQKIRNNYNSDKFIEDFIYLIYLSFDHEINARVSEVYPILMELRTSYRNELSNELKNTSTYKYSEELLNFDITYYNINYEILFDFFVEFNSLVIKKYTNVNFKLYKIPNNENDCKILLKKWIKLFKKKGEYFQNKLSIIIDEIINDVNMINTAFVKVNENLELSNKYILTYDKYLERQSKLYKIFRN